MDFTTAIIHHVSDLTDAQSFLKEVLGFKLQTSTDNGVLVENGALAIRLVQSTEAFATLASLNLEVQTRNIDKTKLLNKSNIQVIEQRVQISQQRIETRLQGPHGIIITLAQEFNEDDLGILPPLPTSLDWQKDAEDCIKKVLPQVPIGFRQSARVRITERAEMLAAEVGLITVEIDQAVKALAQVTPIFQHQAIETTLKGLGIDPGDLFQQDVPS